MIPVEARRSGVMRLSSSRFREFCGRLAREPKTGTDALPSLPLTQSHPLQRHSVQASMALACHLRDVVPGNADVGQLTVRKGIQLPCGLTGTQPATKA